MGPEGANTPRKGAGQRRQLLSFSSTICKPYFSLSNSVQVVIPVLNCPDVGGFEGSWRRSGLGPYAAGH